jgi:hypothetical protein
LCRIITTLIVATNVALVAMVIAFLVFSGRESLFRVDPRTDYVSFIADGGIVWARADYRFREGETAPRKSGKTVVPAGTAIEARLDMEGTSFVLAVPPAGKPLTLQCAKGGEHDAQYLEQNRITLVHIRWR